MTASPKPPIRVVLDQGIDCLIARYREQTFRYLLDDGRTVDVRGVHGGSDLAAAVLLHTGATKIEGVAVIATHEVTAAPPYKPPARKRTVKKV